MTTGRRAGFGRLADGRTVTWNLADGRRGRRWRSATNDANGALESALLLELEPDGRLSKVELETAEGLLSLHPEATNLHGNVVTPEGVRHLRFAWSADHVLLVEDSAISLASAAVLAAPDGAGERRVAPAVVVGSDLSVAETSIAFDRLGVRSVGIEVDGDRRVVELDELGVPSELQGGGAWPLELD